MRGNRIDINDIYVVKGLDCRLNEIECKIDCLLEMVSKIQSGRMSPAEREKFNKVLSAEDKVTNEIKDLDSEGKTVV